MEITSIPKLIALHGSAAKACRATGMNETTFYKYRWDVDCKLHVIVNNRLMTYYARSQELYSRKGVTKGDKANGK